MSSSGIRKLRTTQDRAIDVLREQEQEFIQNLKPGGSEKGGFGLVGLGDTGLGSPRPAGNYLATTGDTMMGPIAYNPTTVSIASNAIDIGLSSEKSSTYVILDSATTDLITITGAQFSGQDLILQGKTGSTITVKNSGNIITPDGADWDINGLAMIRMIYDEASTKWRIYSTVGSGGAGGGANTALSNLTSPTSVNQSLVMNDNDITGLNAIAWTDIGGQISVADATAGFNFVTTSNRPFRFTPNATNIVDITDAGISMIAGDIDLNNLNVIGINALMFNTTGQMITDNANGIRFSMTDATDTFDFTTDSNLNLSIQKYFVDFNNSRIQMTEEIAPSAPASTKNYVYVDSTSHHLTIKHATGSPVDLESGSGGWVGTATSSLDMDNYDITNIGQVESDKLVLNTSGVITLNTNNIIGTTTGIEYNVPSGDKHKFLIAGLEEGINIDEDEIEFAKSGRQHRITVNGSAIQITSENAGDSVELWNGTSRSNPTIDVNDTTTSFRTGTADTNDYRIQIIQNNNTPANFRTISNIDFMAENSASVDTEYARISASSQDTTDTTEDGLLQLGVVSAGTLVSAIDIEGGTSASTGAKIAFFGSSPVLRQTIPSGATLAQVVTALRNLGLGA
tara:strand:+ start:30 stop:1904 length:1875 start_codon:yes stop_codon:yes gene_type:complete